MLQMVDTRRKFVARNVAEVGRDSTAARNKFLGGYTIQFSHCAQYCTVCPSLNPIDRVRSYLEKQTFSRSCRRADKHVLARQIPFHCFYLSFFQRLVLTFRCTICNCFLKLHTRRDYQKNNKSIWPTAWLFWFSRWSRANLWLMTVLVRLLAHRRYVTGGKIHR